MGKKQSQPIPTKTDQEMKSEINEFYKELHEFENDSLKKLEQWEKGIQTKQVNVNKKDKNSIVTIEKAHAFDEVAQILGNVLNEKCPTYKPLVSALTGTVNILISGASASVKSKQGFYLNSQGLGINKFHYFLYVKELKILVEKQKQTNTFIAYGFIVASQTQFKFDDMTAAVETFQLSKQEKKMIWRELAPKTKDGKVRITQVVENQQIAKLLE